MRRCDASAGVFGGNTSEIALSDETCRIVATRMAVHGQERLPVAADSPSGRLVRIVSRSHQVKRSLAFLDEEHRREPMRIVPLSCTSTELMLRRRRAGRNSR
ncbi:hypothetical protein [Paraburkholderia aromaticivorans]|uniref:hypothetical protein n=1 Tax=Paraburkholderia aromaticivorans TaxID=2026199 RepID=UPI0014560813